MRFDRPSFDDHSAVKKQVLNALGKESFAFEASTERESNFVPGGFQGEGADELGALLNELGVTWAAAGTDLRNTLPQQQAKL